VTAQRYRLHEGPRRVLVGKERFSENCAWSEMPQHWPSRVADRAVIEVVGQGRLGVFPTEPYPADGPFLGHPRVMATAHTAALTSDYFVAASRRPGDALASYLDREPPAGLLT
jgi:lactate dehydrogenase-like 2-hydroxyacid dehydrogenase